LVMNAMPYAGNTAATKVSYTDTPVSMDDLRFASIVVACALVPLAFISIWSVASGLLLGTALAAAIALWTRKLIDGYTGDVLGAIEQMFEIGFLLGVAAAIR
jgi:adenosylcobinamide-GDP ribazoletransferase